MVSENSKLTTEFFDTMFKIRKFIKKITMNYLKKADLTQLQMQAIHIIADNPNITVGVLAENLMMSSAAIAQLVDRLVKMNWVTRKNDSKDRRIIRLDITTTGKKDFKKIKSFFFTKMRKVIKLIPEKDIRELNRINSNLLNKMKDIHESNL